MEKKTRFAGVYQIDQGYRVRAYAKDPRTGRMKEVVRTLMGITLQEAIKARVALCEEMLAPPVPKVERMTLTAYAQRWLEEHAMRDRYSTLSNRVASLEHHVLPVLGRMYLDELTPLVIKGWLAKAATKKRPDGRPFAPSTVNGWFRILKAVVRSAVVDLDLPRDPTFGIRALAEGGYGDAGGNVLEPEEISKFLAVAEARFPAQYPMILLGLTTGMRFGELSAVNWEDVLFDRNIVLVRRSQVRGHLSLPKTGKVRRVTIPSEVTEVLAAMRPDPRRGPAKGPVFPTPEGGYHSTTFLAKAFVKIREEAGIERRFTPKGMRRTINTMMVEAGVDRVVLWSMIGHSSERMSEHYAFIGDPAKRKATDQVAKLIRFPLGSNSGVGVRKAG